MTRAAALLTFLATIYGCGSVEWVPATATQDLGASVDAGTDSTAEDTRENRLKDVPDTGETHGIVDAGALSSDTNPLCPPGVQLYPGPNGLTPCP